MKSRRWVLISFVVIFILVVGIQLSWRFFSVNDRLLNLVLGELKPNIQGKVSIEKLEISFGAVHLKKIKIEWKNQPYFLNIQDLQIGYNLIHLLKYNFNPLRFISNIVIDHPDFVFKYSPRSSNPVGLAARTGVDSLSMKMLPAKYRRRLIDLNFVGRIMLLKGTVGVQDSSGTIHKVLQGLDGWISTENLSKALVRMNGRILGAKQTNFGINGRVNLEKGELNFLRLNIINSNLAKIFPEKSKDTFRILKGDLSGQLLLQQNETKNYSNPDLSGSLLIKNVDVDFLNGKIPVRNLTYKLNINHWNATIIHASQNVFGKPVTLEGTVENLLNPRLNLTVSSDAIPVRRVMRLLLPKWESRISGWARLRLKISRSIYNPSFSGEVAGYKIVYNGLPVQRARFLFAYQNSNFSLKSSQIRFQKLRAGASGQLMNWGKAAGGQFNYRISGDAASFVRSLPLRNLDALAVRLNGNVQISQGRIINFARFALTGAGSKIDSLKLTGTASYQNKHLRINAREAGGKFYSRLLINFAALQPKISAEILHLGGTFWDILPVPFEKHLKKRLSVSVKINGEKSKLDYTLVAERKNAESLIPDLFQIDGSIVRQNQETTALGDIQYFPLSGSPVKGDIHLKIDPKSIVLQEYRLGNYYFMTGKIDRKTKSIKGHVEIVQADLNHVFDGLLLQPVLHAQGVMDGMIDLQGTLSDPNIVGQMNLTQGIFNGYGYYNGLISFEFIRKLFRVDQLMLNRGRQQILAISGETNLTDQNLNFQIHGKNVDTQFLSQLFGNRIKFLSGQSTFDLSLMGRWASPDVGGHLEFRNGKLFFVDYDRMSMDLGKTPAELDDRNAESGIRIRKLTLVRKNKFTVHAKAFFPFSNNREMDVRLTGNGDFLALFLEDIAFFKRTASQSTFRFSIGGTYGAPIYTGGTVDFKNGEIDFQSVLPAVRDMKGHVQIEAENQFVHITELTGELGGQPFTLKTFGQDLVSNRPLEPLVIHSWGINFGVFGFKTGPKGIQVHIPGMMEQGDKAWIEAGGLRPGEYFYLAGPSDHPVMRGLATIRDGNFTYPFSKGKPKEKSPNTKPDFMTRVLNRMVWDLTVIPQRNVHFVKKIPGLIDNVWVNLIMESPGNGLRLSGTIADRTFRIVGKMQSTRGSIEYLDLNFAVVKFGIEFDRSEILPIVYGKARTTLTDSTGFPYNIYLTLYTLNPETKIERARGRWGDIRFRLSTDNPNIGTSEGQILGALGYSLGYTRGSFRSKATDVIGISADHLILKPLFRPVERKLEKVFNVDMVSFRTRLAQNMIEMNFNRQIDPRYLIFRSTQVIIGKYLKNNLFLLYSGEIEAGLDPRYQEKGIGLKNSFDLEYRIKPNLLLELQYKYDSLLLSHKQDLRIQIRHSFTF
ncbi:hypothetical protein BMS3Bbin03_01331 [bacterium BMS3Bbin03]|nr:hypothetical protein BMS3Bbin03_01331 [bacterium BMS3Bbin03]